MDTRLKLLKQNLAAFKARLATAADKDQIRRAIKATEDKIREIENA